MSDAKSRTSLSRGPNRSLSQGLLRPRRPLLLHSPLRSVRRLSSHAISARRIIDPSTALYLSTRSMKLLIVKGVVIIAWPLAIELQNVIRRIPAVTSAVHVITRRCVVVEPSQNLEVRSLQQQLNRATLKKRLSGSMLSTAFHTVSLQQMSFSRR